jgi:hypothetical protein
VELSKTVAAIGDDGVEPDTNLLFVNLFFYLIDAAKIDSCGTQGFCLRHARTEVSSTSISRWERTSSSRSASIRREEKRFRRKLRAFTKSGMLSTLRPFQSLNHCSRNTSPASASPSKRSNDQERNPNHVARRAWDRPWWPNARGCKRPLLQRARAGPSTRRRATVRFE